MSKKITPAEQVRHLQDYNKRLTNDQRLHASRSLCQDSRWPYTGDLTPQEIACMRDTYCGRRRKPSIIPHRSIYDSLYHFPEGWNQRAAKDIDPQVRDIQYVIKEEDHNRPVPVFANSSYGHYLARFIDFTYSDHARRSLSKHLVYKHNPQCTLPPIREFNTEST